jgi:hypothetical protein
MSQQDPHFIGLCRLLRTKKYEQPPPGYFSSFADQVITRIEAEEAVEYSSWWSWLVNRFDAKPVLACAYGLAVSSLLFAGLRLSQDFEAEMAATPTVGGPWLAAGPGAPLLFQREYDQVIYGRRSIAPTLARDSQFDLRGSLVPVTAFRLPAGFIGDSH